jgi:hypothetical protein
MNTKLITAIALATVLTSCSSLYKATSTPDDVYYSPAPAAQVNNNGNSNSGSDVGYDTYENYQNSNDDNYLRMKVTNNALWSTIDDYSYWQDSRYDFGFSCNSSRYALLNSFYNPYSFGMYSAWNPLYGFGYGYGYGYYGFGGGGYWGSPYQTVVLYKNPKTYFGTTSKGNLTAFHNLQYNNSNFFKTSYNNGNYGNSPYSSRNNTFYNNNNNTYQPARSFNIGSSNSSAGGRSGGFNSAGSSAPASRPTRH